MQVNNTGRMEDTMKIHKDNSPKTLLFIFVSLAVIIFISISSILIVNAAEQNNQSSHKYYTSIVINSSDTLWDIAQEYNSGSCDIRTYINDIKKLNNMTSDTIYAGQSLIVYYYSDEVK